MRCCSRSTGSRGSLAALALGVALLAGGAWPVQGQPAAAAEPDVRQAIVEAVRAKMGQDAEVRVEELRVQLTGGTPGAVLAATPETGARLGRPTRFSLAWRRATAAGAAVRPGSATPGGHAVATVSVAVVHVRSARVIARGETCEETDVVEAAGDVGQAPMQHLPRLAETVGTRAIRDIGVDEVVTRTVLAVRQVVQSGDVVAVRADIGPVSARSQGVAVQSGGVGDVIRVVNQASRRSLRARVVGPGEVEVVQ